MELWSDEQERPLQHLRIIDLTIMLPGPLVTRTLAQFGANVIKIEATPAGDPLRSIQQTTKCFDFLNQGKHSTGLNLHSPKGIEIIRRLASESDVFVENYRDGVMDRYGLGYSQLSEDNPDILYVSLRGLRGEPGKLATHDLNFIAASGCGEWFLENGAPNMSSQFGDVIGGSLVPLIRILGHLANPARRGMHLVTYMEEGFRMLYLPRAWDAIHGESKTGFGIQTVLGGNQPHSRYYRCRDNQWIAINAVQTKHWETLCKAIDRMEWVPRHADPTLIPELEKIFLDAPASYWEVRVKGMDVCLLKVIPWTEHLASTDARARLTTDAMTWAGFAPAHNLKPSPSFGRDTYTVLHSAGLNNAEIATMIQAGDAKAPG